MSLTPQDLKRGTIFYLDGQIYESLEYRQAIQARQQASVTVKARNLQTGKLVSQTFRGSEELAPAELSRPSVLFLYGDGRHFHFMDGDGGRQYELPAAALAGKAAYLAEGQSVVLLLLEDRPLTAELPKNVWLKVESAPEVVRGDTASAVYKQARLSTGLTVKVPAFIKAGDIVSVDTATGAYRERQK